MALLTALQLQEHIETDLPDTALTRILDSNDALIIARAGPLAAETEMQYFGLEEIDTELFWLKRKASAITTVIETVGTTDTTLASDDYALDSNGLILRRLSTGTNQRILWGNRVKVTYVPADETDIRTIALVNLCLLDIQYSALKSEGIGDYKSQSVDYQNEREKILSGFGGRWWA